MIVADVAPPETLPLYQAELSDVENVRIVLLMADVETLLQRDRDRDPNPNPDPEPLRIWHDRIRMLHHELASASDVYDEVIDNGSVAAEETAKRLLSLFL